MILNGIDFTFCSAEVDRTNPNSWVPDSNTLQDAAAEFAKSATFKAFCVHNRIAMEKTPAYTHTFNARAEGAVCIVKEHMRCLLRSANLPSRFWTRPWTTGLSKACGWAMTSAHHVLHVLVQATQRGTSQRSPPFRPYFAFPMSGEYSSPHWPFCRRHLQDARGGRWQGATHAGP